jgi:putative ABC transport system permease protein
LEKNDPTSVNAVKAALDRNLEQEGIRALGSLGKGEGRYGFDQHMVMIYVFLVIVASALATIGGLGLMTTMSLNVLERRREMGVLRAIGATPTVIGRIIMAEGLVVGLMSWAIAAVAAWPVSKLIASGIGMHVFRTRLDFAFETRAVFIWLAVSVLLGLIASFIPAWNASRVSVREAVGYE